MTMRKAEALDLVQHVMEDLGVPACHWAAHADPARIEFLREDRNGHHISDSVRLKASWSQERIIEALEEAVNKPLPEPVERKTPELLELTP